ncbi:MAG TPA: LysM peptidoglycan-binding domain-containing protein [Chthoniobacterales bacterium]
MSTLGKAFIIVALVATIFGGGGYLAYRLFLKKKEYQLTKGGIAVPTATPDLVQPLLVQAKAQIAQGDKGAARATLVSIVQGFPPSPSADEARQILGNMNMHDFFSSEPGPNKTIYLVARGDSIGRISAKTKAAPELIFKANGLENLTIQPGRKFVIPSGQFSLNISIKRQSLTLLNRGVFFKWYKPLEFKAPTHLTAGQYKVTEKIAWVSGGRVAFGDKHYLGSSRWIMTNISGLTIFSETNPQAPNAQKPSTGIMLSPPDLEEIYALVGKKTPITVE